MSKRQQLLTDDTVTAADIIAFIEQTCFIPEGKFVGKKLVLFDWQKREIERIYNNPQGTRRAIISMPRKNAKTCLSCSRTYVARRRGRDQIRSFTRRRSHAIRRRSFSP